ncbi:MAG: hypothetical protein ACYS7Y_30840, partial [Planctomycetota bacterium]
ANAGTGILEELANLRRLGQRPQYVQVHAPQEDLVGAQYRRLDALLAQVRHHQIVDTIEASTRTPLFTLKLTYARASADRLRHARAIRLERRRPCSGMHVTSTSNATIVVRLVLSI